MMIFLEKDVHSLKHKKIMYHFLDNFIEIIVLKLSLLLSSLPHL